MQIALKDAAKLFNISEREMLRWVDHRSAPVHMAQERHLFNRAELAEWARENGVSMGRRSAVEGSPVHDALLAGGIIRLKGGSSRDAILKELTDLLPLPENASREELAEMLIARERQSSTGVGEGLAIPHVRTPLILNTEEPLLNLCLLENPIDFSSPDGKPAYALFTMISPNARVHLEMISRLAGALSDRGLKNALERRAPDAEILEAVESAEAGRTSK